jgi:hypothetical protein
MKKKFIKFCKISLCAALVVSALSCQTEELSDVTASSSEAELSAKKVTSIIFDECNDVYETTNLYAGQNILVGNVAVVVNGDNYEITYNITNSGYCLSATHLSVVSAPLNFPMTKTGNPIPGQFEYSESHECVSSYTYTVPKSKGTYIAAHAVVNCITTGSLEDIDALLPETADFCITTGREIENASSYFYIEIADGSLAGNYWGWCADESKTINTTNGPICYEQFNVYSLLDDVSGIISLPDNIDNALWLINNANDILNNGYEYGYIQLALWKLLNDQECNNCNANLKLPAGDITVKGNEVYDMAMANGDGYSPECGENTMVILDNGIQQPVIITVPIECNEGDCEETAMGAGCDFPGNNWFTYFQYGS